LASHHIAEPRPDISVVVLTYNHVRDIEECIRSVLESETAPLTKEVILVDNASTDGTADLVRNNFPTVKVVQNPTNIGYGPGFNVGVANSSGQFVVILNPDVTVPAGSIKALVQALRDDPAAKITTSKILMYDDRDRINACGVDLNYAGFVFSRGLGASASLYREDCYVGAPSGCAFAIRRDTIEKLGLFDELFFLRGELSDLGWKVLSSGFKIRYVSGSTVYHKYRFKLDPFWFYYNERGRLLMVLKNYSSPTLVKMIPILVISEGLVIAYSISRGSRHLLSKLRSYYWIVKNRRTVLAHRREFQSLRKVPDSEIVKSMIGGIRQINQATFGARHATLVERELSAFYNGFFEQMKRSI
jgi:GT2 family glycosyltransferase